MKTGLFSLISVGFFTIVGLCLVPEGRADCCSGCATIVSSSCCNVFGCNCDGPCSNFGCGGTPRAAGDYCGVVSGYYTFIYNKGCAFTDEGAAPGSTPKAAAREEGPMLIQAPAKPQERFDAIDTIRNGSISLQEAQAWVKQNGGSGISETDVQAKFKEVDKNGDGKVEPGEFDFTLAKK